MGIPVGTSAKTKIRGPEAGEILRWRLRLPEAIWMIIAYGQKSSAGGGFSVVFRRGWDGY